MLTVPFGPSNLDTCRLLLGTATEAAMAEGLGASMAAFSQLLAVTLLLWTHMLHASCPCDLRGLCISSTICVIVGQT